MFNKPPLDGIKVIDFSTMIAGPLAASMLADYGADVIKVEPTSSCDLMRFVGTSHNGISGIFALNNRGKRSISIDMASDDGIRNVRKLMRTADIVIHNHRHGVMESRGIGYEDVVDEMPNLIYVHVQGYGRYGEMRTLKAYDNMVQAMTGMGFAQNDPPEVVHQLVCDKVTAHVVAQAVMAALITRGRDSRGQKVEVSLLDAAAHFMWQDLGMDAAVLNSDAIRAQTIDKYYRTVHLKDGYCAVTPASDDEFRIWMETIGLTEILNDERFSSIGARFANAAALIQLTDNAARNTTVSQVRTAIREHSLPAAIFETVDDMPSNQQIMSNNIFHDTVTTSGTRIRQARLAPIFSNTPIRISNPAPHYGEHTEQILGELDEH